jgi:hypothetical protein
MEVIGSVCLVIIHRLIRTERVQRSSDNANRHDAFADGRNHCRHDVWNGHLVLKERDVS